MQATRGSVGEGALALPLFGHLLQFMHGAHHSNILAEIASPASDLNRAEKREG